jgi:hypothetical protein
MNANLPECRSVDQLFADASRLRSEYRRIRRFRIGRRAAMLQTIAATLLQLEHALDERREAAKLRGEA